METDPRLQELLSRWHDLHQKGQTPTPEDLCAGCPELAGELRRRLEAVASLEGFLGVRNGDLPSTLPSAGGPALTGDFPATGPEQVPVAPAGYEILGELGRGGMGVVYLAKQTRAGRLVALKMIRNAEYAGPDERERFRAEAMALARLQHPHVVQIFEVGEHLGMPFFSLEYCPAGSLAGRLGGTPLPPRQAATLTLELARALEAAHACKVLHRDIKPANVLLAGEPDQPLEQCRARLTDFGLARRQDVTQQTQSGAIVGTPSYMSPEQAAGKSKEMGPATDVYGLGALLYELLTGRPPFQGTTSLETVLQVLEKEPVAPRLLQPAVPRDLETVCLKCLEKEPKGRYATAEDLGKDLQWFLEGEPVRARPVRSWERAWKWAKRRPVLALSTSFAVTAVLFLLVGVVYYNGRLEKALGEKQQAYTDLEKALGEKQKAYTDLAHSKDELEMLNRRLEIAYKALESDVAEVADDAFKAGRFEECDQFSELLLRKNQSLGDETIFRLANICIQSRQKLNRPAGAIQIYDFVIRRWVDEDKLPSEYNDDFVGYYRRYIQPALELGQPFGDNFSDKALLARLHYAKGKIILDNYYEDWNFPRGPFAEAADSFSRAVDLYPGRDKEKAKYIALHGCALAGVRPRDLAAMSQDADEALDIKSDEMNGLTLKALCGYYRAAGMAGKEEEKYARDSIDTSLKAIQVARDKKEAEGLVAYNHVNISMVNVLLANIARNNKDKALMDATLKEAREHVEEAIRLQPKNPGTWMAKGSILEDQAWSGIGSKPALYTEAVEAFTTQIRCRPAAPQGYVNLARVYIKWAQDDRQAPDFKKRLVEARKNLKLALKKKSSYAEAHYWQGALDLLEGNKDEALKDFAKAISDPANPRLWLDTIRNEHIKNDWKPVERVKAWEDLFGHLLPAGQPAKPEQALPLTLRAEVLFAIPEVKGDLKRLAGLIRDVDQAAELSKENGKARAYALSLAAQFRWEAAKLSPDEQKSGYLEAADEKVREMLKADPNVAYAQMWAAGLAQRLEAKSSQKGLATSAKAKLLKEAIDYATLAVEKTPESEKKDQKEKLARLKQALHDLGADP